MSYRKVLVTSLIVVLAVWGVAALPAARAFTYGSSYGAYASAAAASDYYGIYNSDNSTMSHNQGDGATTASASASASDSAGGSASSSASVNAATHTITAASAADCTGSSDCYDTYYGGYTGLGGNVGANMYDTYSVTCATCSYIDISVNYTITGTFGALDNGPYCQGTGEYSGTLSAVACYSEFHPTIAIGSTNVCAGGDHSYDCPPNVVDYQQGWTFCQTGTDYLFYCPSSTSFTISGTVDLSALMQDEGFSFTAAYPAPGGNTQINFGFSAGSNVELPLSESASGSVTYTVYSSTPGVTVTSAASGSQITTPPESSTTTVQLLTNPVAVGSPTTVRTVVSGNLVDPTGTVTLSSSGTGSFSPSNVCTLAGTVCSVTYTPTAGGSPVTITANYGGDGSNLASMGNSMLTVTGGSKTSSSTAASCAPNTVAPGTSSTCSATVTGSSPTGTVTWSSSSGTPSFSDEGECTLSAGSCQVTYTDSTSGAPVITATYGGDSNNFGSSGSFILANFSPAATAAQSTSGTTSEGGSVSANQLEATGVSVTVTGAPDSTATTIFSSDLPSQPSGTGSLSISGLGFYDVEISGISTGTAEVCITNTGVTSSTVLQYYYEGSWLSATLVSVTPGEGLCADIPVVAVNGTPLVLGAPPASPSPPVALVCPTTFGGTLMPVGATFTDGYGNTWTAPGGTIDGGTYSSYFFAGAQSSIPQPMMQGWGGVYGTFDGQQGWIISFYC